ncbi:PQQ-like beta-propeller repeat protein [bacterium]|nr:PQQ-like beta-propeller repeat protein [bacterium]
MNRNARFLVFSGAAFLISVALACIPKERDKALEVVWDVACDNIGYPQALAADDGNVYVLGTKMIRAYDSDGNPLWSKPLNDSISGRGLALDKDYLYVVGNKENPDSIWMARLDVSSGDSLWVASFGDPSGWIEANDICVRGLYVYAAGKVGGTIATDFLILERDKTLGVCSYQWRINESDDGSEELLVSITSDNTSIYATGHVLFYYGWTLKIPIEPHEPGWPVQWGVKYDSPYIDNMSDIAADESGNSYVVGETNTASSREAVIVKYNSAGMQQWYKSLEYDSASASFFAVKLDDSGYVYAAGLGYDKEDSVTNMLVCKFNTSGEMLWQYRYEKSYESYAVDLAIVGEDVYVLMGTGSGSSVVKFKNFYTQDSD